MARSKKTVERKPVVDARGMMLLPLDADYVLRPDYEAIQAIEQQLGSLTELSGMAVGGRLSCDAMAVIAAEMMKAEGRRNPQAGPSYKDPNPDKLSRLIFEAGVPQVTARLAIVLMGAVTGGYTATGEPKPAA